MLTFLLKRRKIYKPWVKKIFFGVEVICMTAKDLFEQVLKTGFHHEKPKSKSIGEDENRALLAGEEAKLQQLNYASQINH